VKLPQKNKYDPPEVGTVFMLRSRYTEDARLGPIKRIASVLQRQGLISEDMKPVGYSDIMKVRLGDYANKFPNRKHTEHWIDGGKQVAVFHPDTCLPFFLNVSGSGICRLCDGRHNVGELIALSRKKWPSSSKGVLVTDLMRFLFLLEELDLIEFEG
jgi:hypothetical protein